MPDAWDTETREDGTCWCGSRPSPKSPKEVRRAAVASAPRGRIWAAGARMPFVETRFASSSDRTSRLPSAIYPLTWEYCRAKTDSRRPSGSYPRDPGPWVLEPAAELSREWRGRHGTGLELASEDETKEAAIGSRPDGCARGDAGDYAGGRRHWSSGRSLASLASLARL